MRSLGGSADIEQALQRVGELLAAAGEPHAVVIVGGAALSLLGVVTRTTRDVDVLAFGRRTQKGAWKLEPPPQPLPEVLLTAVRAVARDLGLAEDWLNAGPASQWKQGLPPGLARRIQWRRYAALHVGVVGRQDLIRLKLYAAADGAPAEQHARDLAALAPTDAELLKAAAWVKTQDAASTFPATVDEVVAYVRSQRG